MTKQIKKILYQLILSALGCTVFVTCIDLIQKMVSSELFSWLKVATYILFFIIVAWKIRQICLVMNGDGRFSYDDSEEP